MSLFLTCIITVVVETVFFRFCGFKSVNDLTIIALSNVITNLALNVFLMLVPDAFTVLWIVILELLVVAAEYLIYRRAFGKVRLLLLFTFIANVLSFAIGVLFEELFLY